MDNLRIRDVFNITDAGLWEYLPTYGVSSKINVNRSYLLRHSGMKPVAPIIEALVDDNNKITGSNLEVLADIISDECRTSWDRIYDALTAEYELLDNYNGIETIEVDTIVIKTEEVIVKEDGEPEEKDEDNTNG